MAMPVVADDVPYRSSARITDVSRTDAQERAAMKRVAKISLAQAKKIAQNAAPGARLVEAELENEDGNVVYEVEFKDRGQERKIIVDAGNGKILLNKVDDD